MPTLKIKAATKIKLNIIKEAEKNLAMAGVTFDTGYDMMTQEREWHLDFSLKGAKLEK